MPSLRHSSAMLSSPRRPSSTMRILSSAEKCRRVCRRMSFTTRSAGAFTSDFFKGVGLHLRSFVTTAKPQPSLNHNLKSVPLVLTGASQGISGRSPRLKRCNLQKAERGLIIPACFTAVVRRLCTTIFSRAVASLSRNRSDTSPAERLNCSNKIRFFIANSKCPPQIHSLIN